MLSTRGYPKVPNEMLNMRTVIKKMISHGRNSISVKLGGPNPMARSIGIKAAKSIEETINIVTKKIPKLLNIPIVMQDKIKNPKNLTIQGGIKRKRSVKAPGIKKKRSLIWIHRIHTAKKVSTLQQFA